MIDKRQCIKIISDNDDRSLRRIVHDRFSDDESTSLAEVIIQYGNTREMDILLSEGYNFAFADSLEYTLMEYACLYEKPDLVKWLIDHDLRIQRYRYEFCYAAERNNLQIVKMLLDNGYSASDVEESGRNGLHYAAQENYLELCELLLKNGCAANQLDVDGFSPLYIASSENNVEIVNLLLSAHAKVDLCGGDYTSPFVIACSLGNYMICDILLSHHADINMQDIYGRTALIYAAIKSDEKCIDYLLSHGADSSICDEHGYCFSDIQSNDKLREKLYYDEFIAD